MAQPSTSESEPESGGKALLLIGAVFGVLALTVVLLFAALKWTEPKQTLMGTTAAAEQQPDVVGGVKTTPVPSGSGTSK